MPAAAVGVEKLVSTTVRAMAKAQGAPDYPIAVIPHELGVVEDLRDDEEVSLLPQNGAPPRPLLSRPGGAGWGGGEAGGGAPPPPPPPPPRGGGGGGAPGGGEEAHL